MSVENVHPDVSQEDVSVPADLEEQVWVEEPEMFPCRCCLTLAPWVCEGTTA